MISATIMLVGDPDATGRVTWTPERGPELQDGTLGADVAAEVRAYLGSPIPVPLWDEPEAGELPEGATDGFQLEDASQAPTVDPTTRSGFLYALDALLDATPCVLVRSTLSLDG